VNDGQLFISHFLFQIRDEEIPVHHRRTAIEGLDGLEFIRDIGKRIEPLNRFGQAGRENFDILPFDGMGIRQIETGCNSHCILLDEELFSIVKGGDGNGSKGAIRDKDEGLRGQGCQVRFKGANEPIVQSLCVGKVFPVVRFSSFSRKVLTSFARVSASIFMENRFIPDGRLTRSSVRSERTRDRSPQKFWRPYRVLSFSVEPHPCNRLENNP